jgi:hypothetical protein
LRLRPYLATEIDANQAKNATKIAEGIVVPSFPTKFGPNAAAIITAIHIIEIPRDAHNSGILRNSAHCGRRLWPADGSCEMLVTVHTSLTLSVARSSSVGIGDLLLAVARDHGDG